MAERKVAALGAIAPCVTVDSSADKLDHLSGRSGCREVRGCGSLVTCADLTQCLRANTTSIECPSRADISDTVRLMRLWKTDMCPPRL